MAHEIGAGAVGTSGKYKTTMPIKDVLNMTGQASCDSMGSFAAILKAVPIKNKVVKLAKKAQSNVNENKEEIDGVYTNYFDKVEESNSKRLNLSEGAINSKEILNNISTNIGALKDAVESYMKEDIDGIVTEYNDRLEKLKRGAKVKLMVIRANELNEAAKDGRSKYYFRANVPFEGKSSPQIDHFEGDNKWVRYINVSYTETYYPPQSASRGVTETKYRGSYTEYKYINYEGSGNWGPLTCTEADVRYLEEKFTSLGIPLPYSESGELVSDVQPGERSDGSHISSSGTVHGGFGGKF